VCVRAPGAACTAFTPDARATEGAGDLVFRVRLPLGMERRTGGVERAGQGKYGAQDGACGPLVTGGVVVDLSGGDL